MKVLLYGHAGWIGSQFASLVESSGHTLARGTARCSDVAMLRREVAKEQPSHVVAIIGRTHGKFGDIEFPTIDYLEQPGKLADNVRDNLTAPVPTYRMGTLVASRLVGRCPEFRTPCFICV